MFALEAITKDKNLYAVANLPLVTLYDDNHFVRNDYDVLSLGQRNYLINFFKQQGFKQKSGRLLTDGSAQLHLPRPNSNLATSAFDSQFCHNDEVNYHCVTPTQFAEVLFHTATDVDDALNKVKSLIEVCPYNIEWLRDISYRSEIEQITIDTFAELTEFQKQVVAEKFKMKKAL